MTRTTYVWRPGRGMIPKGEDHPPESRHPGIMPDLPDFVSPIDGRLYRGRAGMRDHCARHAVVPNADLKGLPVLTLQSDQRHPQDRARDRAERKQTIINQVNRLKL